MPVITLANPKGGSGKTTTATLLSTAAAHQGATVSLIDCDPNAPHKIWRGGASQTAVQFLAAKTETDLLDAVEVERTQRQLVVIDLEGVANRMMSRAIMLSDLVLIPMAPTALDAKEAARTVALVKEEERLLGRAIPHQIVFTSTAARGATNEEKDILDSLRGRGVPFLKTQLNEWAAFQAVFSRRLTLYELDPAKISNLDKAIKNAEDLTDEVATILRGIAQQKRTAA